MISSPLVTWTIVWATRLWPSLVTAGITAYASYLYVALMFNLSGALILCLMVGSAVFATWLTSPVSLVYELRRAPPMKHGWLVAVPVVAACVVIASFVIARLSLSAFATPIRPHFDWSPANFATGALIGFAALGLYPYRKLEMLPEKMTLVAVLVAVATFALTHMLWIGMLAAVVVRTLCRVCYFYFGERLARASFPVSSKRLA